MSFELGSQATSTRTFESKYESPDSRDRTRLWQGAEASVRCHGLEPSETVRITGRHGVGTMGALESAELV